MESTADMVGQVFLSRLSPTAPGGTVLLPDAPELGGPFRTMDIRCLFVAVPSQGCLRRPLHSASCFFWVLGY